MELLSVIKMDWKHYQTQFVGVFFTECANVSKTLAGKSRHMVTLSYLISFIFKKISVALNEML